MKKIISALLISAMLMSCVTVFAYDYPNGFWAVNSKYVDALNANNHADIVKYGTQVVNLMKNAAEGSEKKNIMISRYNQLGHSYAALGDYANSAAAFNSLYTYASKYGSEFYDYAKAAKARALQYTPSVAMYTDNGPQVYYGAKNEKQNGVLFGICANGGTRSKLKNESMTLIYQELGKPFLAYNKNVLAEAENSGIAVEYALNCTNEGNDIRNIQNLTSSLQEISDVLKEYDTVPVYLRFAAEFDVWSVMATPDEFKSAFRYVSEYFKSRNKNVAMVWSLNQVSAWNVNADDYYPGDSYVDWVGISLYAQPYFLGDKNAKDENEVVFKSGRNSDPVIAIKEIVEKYGTKKPVMISESGCGHTLVQSGEDTSGFAVKRLKEYYSYLPMVYPQVKLIAYFDWFVDGEKNDFRLSSNSTLQQEYLKLVKGDRFIHGSFSNDTDIRYRKVSDGTWLYGVFPVSCYAHKYNTDPVKVTYFIDGNYVGQSAEVPFTTYIDANKYSGTHTLKAVAAFSDGQTLSTQSKVNINGAKKDISVEISGKKVEFDSQPVSYNNRTLVPMRKIFEELGAEVGWDGATMTASATKGDKTVKLTIGSRLMYINSTEITLDTAPIVLSERTLVPVRAVAEGLDCDVNWNSGANTVEIEPKS